MKRRIVTAYAAEGPDVDTALRSLRAALEPTHGRGFAFVDLVDGR